MKLRKLAIIALIAAPIGAQETVAVQSKAVERKVKLPGELLPYQRVDIHARVTGFIESIDVDRGSVVKKGQVLATLSAPEMAAQIAESEAKVHAIESQRAEADSKRIAAQSTFEKLKAASATPGAIAGNELLLAQKSVDAAQAVIQSLDSQIRAARASVDAQKELMSYLKITAPFDGMITERFLHPGALVGPGAGAQAGPLLRLEQISRLRLVVPVPEPEVGGIVRGGAVTFSVPDQQGSVFKGTVTRVPRTLDPKTRTMPVELDVVNPGGRLAPGMYPEVTWPVKRAHAVMLVPPTAVVATTERSFVVRVSGGKAEWVNVVKGQPAGELIEVMGNLQPGDVVVKRASDEIREGTPIKR